MKEWLFGLITGEKAMRRWFIASLVCNMGIIVTGAIVRLTGSGLGCSTWPQCVDGSYTPHAATGMHSYIEFGNRLLTFVLIFAAVGAFSAAWRNLGRGSKVWWVTLSIGLGIPFQAVIGGITVLTGLNPWVVSLHLVLSVALIVLCVWALVLISPNQPTAVSSIARIAIVFTFCVSMLTIYWGTVVTGAGPHAGDADAPRNGLDIVSFARIHSMLAWLTTLSTIVSVWLVRKTPARTPAIWLLVSLLYQGAVGYAQYFLGLPIGIVILHMLGTTFVTASAAWLLTGTRSVEAESIKQPSIATAKSTR